VVIVLVGVATAGCTRTPVTPPAGVAPKPTAAQVVSSTSSRPSETPDKPGDQQPTVESSPTTADNDSNSGPPQTTLAADGHATKLPEEKPAPAERIAILTPGGPVLADVVFLLGGKPHSERFTQNIDEVLTAADTDKDGRSTWEELVANEEYLASSQPGGQPLGPRQLKMLIEQYDENRDGAVQSSEAASWLGRNLGAAAQALRIRSSRWYRTNPRASSRVWQLLDSNQDARLSTEEMSAAADKLFLFDANDDRVIAPPELASLREQLDAANPQAMSVSRDATRFGAIHLDEIVDADRLDYVLSDLYASRQSLGPGSFAGLPQLFARLDANADQVLEQLELADLCTFEPHLRLSVAFDEPGKTEPGAAVLTLDAHNPDVAIISQTANRLVLSVAGTRLIVSAQDVARGETPGEMPDQSVLLSQVSAMIHDQCDAVFEIFDANADGRLGERETTGCATNLLKKDTNGDGQLAADELSHCMIVAFMRGERPNEDAFYIPSLGNVPTHTEPAAKWFTRADFNGDGDISRREFLGSLEQFTRLDADQNDYIRAEEAGAFKAN
jgi:Ca2+-binding EF-hand superfamily protein